MAVQHRRYQLTPGSLDRFVKVWAEQVVPLRRSFGFEVVAAWTSAEPEQFIWVVRHDGDFAEAEQAYYASPDRSRIDPDPASMIEQADVVMVDEVPPPAAVPRVGIRSTIGAVEWKFDGQETVED